MKKTMMCLTAVAWLWVARGQEKGIAQREPQKPVKTQRVISFKPDDRSPEKTLADLLNPSKEEKFIKVKSKGDPDHQIVTDIYDQYFKGVRVDGGQIRIVKQKGKLKYALQDYEEITTTINITPKLSKEAAINSALQKIGARKYAWQEPQREKSLKERKKDPNSSYYPKPELVILSETGQLAYKMEIFATNPWTREEVFVDAQTGAIAKKYDLLSDDNHVERLAKAPELKAGSVEQALSLNPTPIWLKIYGYDKLSSGVTDNSNQNAYLNDLLYKNHTQSIAGVTGKDPEGPFSEFNTANIDAQGFGDFRNINDINFEVAQKVHLGLESAATYFASNYSRMGYDGASGPIHAYVYSYKIGGAFYDREESLFFPYDDGEYQPEIKIHPQLQTVYHEYAHAFTVSESGLIGGSTESGVLNEALSDIWSYTVADYYLKKHPSDFGDPWTYNSLFGNTWTTTSGNQEFQDWYKSQKGYSVNRISKDPNSDNHPDFYNGQYWDPLNQDPHFNSTVISYWYYLLSVGGNVNPENDPGTTISIAGIGIEKAAKIIYLVTTNLLNANTKYEGFALRTTLAAKLIFGEDSPELNSTLAAWAAVGLGDLNFGSPVGCIPPADYNPKMFIQSFELANVKTDKPNDFIGGYRDYSFLNIEGKSNYSYDFKIKSFSKPYVPNLYWSVWIDIDGNSTFDANEKIASGWPSASATITLPTLLKGPKSIMRIVLSADQNASPCFNPLNDKEPKYMEDYGITIEEYCPIVKWTNPDFTNAHPKFNGLIFNNITLTACGGTEVFNENPASQQILLDETSKTIIGGKDYSLTFNFKPSGDSEVHLNPKGTDKPNTFLTDCITQPPYGFSLGDFDDDPNKDESGSGGSSDLTAKCSSVSEDIFEFTVCPQRFRRMVWIDFNRNGQFEKNEQYETLFDATSKTFYVNFTIPNWATTLKGKTRIRIYAYLGNGALFGGNACGDGINGMPEKIFKGEPVISKTAIDIDINLDKQIYQLDMKAAPDQPADQVEMQPVSLSLYPNPASNLVDLSIKGTTTDNFTLELYDSNGNRLLVKQPWDGRSLDISRYPDGLYLITLKRDREVYTQKLLIQR